MKKKNNRFNHITVVNIFITFKCICLYGRVCLFFQLLSFTWQTDLSTNLWVLLVLQNTRGFLFLFLWGKPEWMLFERLFLRKSFCVSANIKMYQHCVLTRFHLFAACVWRQILSDTFVVFIFHCWSWAALVLNSRWSFVGFKICAVL